MINDEAEFLKEFEDEKVDDWKESYLDYINLKNKINKIKDSFIKNKDIKSENEKKDKKGEIKESNNFSIKLNEIVLSEKKSNLIENIEEIDESLKSNNDILSNLSMETEKKLDILGKPTKIFMELLDEEIKKIHIFYTRKEKKLYNDMNLQLRLYESIKNQYNNERKMKIISDLEYLSNISYELINYVYINIKALKRILRIYDMNLIEISYNYLKKNLSKNNGNLVYIINFKILDEVVVVIQQLFLSIQEDLYNSNFFNNNKNEKDAFDENCREINDNLEMIDDLYQDIFEELKPWVKYLKISLGQSTSSYKSVFKETSLFGDSLFRKTKKAKKNKNKNKNQKIMENRISQKIDEKEKSLVYIKNIDEIEQKLDKINIEEKTLYANSDLFEKSDIFSYKTKNVLNSDNLRNLKILYPLVLFFSFSCSFLIPNIIILMKEGQFYEVIFLYSIILSADSLGNFFSKLIFKCLISMPFKSILLFYYIIFLIQYEIILLGTFYGENIFSIILIIVGRFLLGFSYIKHLSKEYVDQFVPKINQINANKNYMFCQYIGFALGILSNALYYYKDNFNFDLFNIKINFIRFFIIVYLLLTLILFFVVICNFIEPTNNVLLNEEFIKETKNHRLSRNLIDNVEKKEAAFHDNNYSIANSSCEFAQTNLLTNFISQHLDMNYYNKICIILIFLLISTEYTRENLLLLIPRLFYYIYKIYPNNELNIYLFLGSITFFALFYILSFYFIRCFLKKHYTISFKTRFLFIIMFILFILSLSFIFLIKTDIKIFDDLLMHVIFPQIIIAVIFMLNELYHIIIINIFIYLLPSEEIKMCCIRLSSLINFITKFVRIIPSIIIIILYSLFKDEDFESEIILNQKEINYCNLFLFGMQSSIFLICFLFSLCFRSYFRNTSKIRIRNKYI